MSNWITRCENMPDKIERPQSQPQTEGLLPLTPHEKWGGGKIAYAALRNEIVMVSAIPWASNGLPNSVFAIPSFGDRLRFASGSMASRTAAPAIRENAR
jgi:hypothetical protein